MSTFAEMLGELDVLASGCPELNVANYNEEGVRELNDWAVEVSLKLESLVALSRAMPQDGGQPYGSTEMHCSFVVPQLPQTLRLLSWITRSLGNDHPAYSDVQALANAAAKVDWASRGQGNSPRVVHDVPVQVCPIKDATCGDRPQGWCQTCPKRNADAARAQGPDTRQKGEGAAPSVVRNNPVSALAIRILVESGLVSQADADTAFTVACEAMEDEAQCMNVQLPWAGRQPRLGPVVQRTDPVCRDCADFGPICPNSGKPCGGGQGDTQGASHV